MLRSSRLAILVACLAAPAHAAENGTVTGKIEVKSEGLFAASGDVSEAIVYLERLEGASPAAPGAGAELAQKNKTFEPGVVVVQQGAVVRFPNKDKVFHNVFSLTSGTEPWLRTSGSGSSKSVR